MRKYVPPAERERRDRERREKAYNARQAALEAEKKRPKSNKPVITLIVPRNKGKRAFAYGIQVAFLDRRGDEVVCVRLYDENGNMVEATNYNPENWMAAPAGMLGEITLLKGAAPQVWYPYEDFRRFYTNVYDYPGGGDYITNNGQHDWPERDWKAEWDEERRAREEFKVKKDQWKEEMNKEDERRRAAWGEGLNSYEWHL